MASAPAAIDIIVDDEFAALIPPSSADDLAILEESLLKDGCRDPLRVTPDGVLLDGHNRLRLCRRHGIDFRVEVVNVADRDEAKLWIITNQLTRRNLSKPARIKLAMKREPLIRALAKANSGTRTDLMQNSAGGTDSVVTREAAARLAGLSHDTYTKGKRVFEQGAPELVQAMEAETVSIHAAAQVADLPPDEQREAVTNGLVKQVAKALPSRRQGASGSQEWYTPVDILDLAREVLGPFDLDPASCVAAQKRVRATTYYDKDQDGLSKPWTGTVWLNPPFARGLMIKFVEKLVAELTAGNVTAAILLTNSETETVWFQEAASKATKVFFPRGRIRFLRGAAGTQGSPQMGQTLFYFGPDEERFAEVFGKLGTVCVPLPSSATGIIESEGAAL